MRIIPDKSHRSPGFSLLELCVGMALVALLAGMAAPSFRVALRNAAVRTAAYELMTGLQQVRATAVVESLTGALGDVAPDATAFPWRRDAASIQWYSEPSTPETVAAATAWLSSAHEKVKAHSVGAYVNYLEPGIPAQRYFGDNLSRLTSVRNTYDPNGVMGSGLDY